MKSLEELLDDLAAYVDTPEASCVSLPPDASTESMFGSSA